jgi:purine-binding chemotaxis protein CheW
MTRQIVVFSLGGEEYALPIDSVSEIIRHAEPRTVASDTPDVHGVIGLRGKIVPIVDLAGRLGLASTGTDPAGGKVIILDADGGQLGIVVDEVDEVLTVPTEQLEAVPAAGSAVEAIAKLDDRLIMLLDAAAFVAAGQPAAA